MGKKKLRRIEREGEENGDSRLYHGRGGKEKPRTSRKEWELFQKLGKGPRKEKMHKGKIGGMKLSRGWFWAKKGERGVGEGGVKG